jgi:cytochrome c556
VTKINNVFTEIYPKNYNKTIRNYMKSFTSKALVCALAITSISAFSEPAKSLKHAKGATELRQSVFKLLGNNMGRLGAMAKGKIPFDADIAETSAKRINQLSLMIADYTKTDTSGFKVQTEALDGIWKKPQQFSESIEKLTLASMKLQKIATTKDESAIKAAIGGVGKSCGGCHDVFKAE